MNLKVEEIAQITCSEIIGSKDFTVTDLSFMKNAKPGDLVLATDIKYFRQANESPASVILTDKVYEETEKIIILNDNPNTAYLKILERIYVPNGFHSENSSADSSAKIAKSVKTGFNSVIGKNTEIGTDTVIHPNVFIGDNCKIGKNCVIYPGTVIYDRTIIGNNVILHGGVVIGADGFGYEASPTGLLKYPHTGFVEIEDNVEIGANTCVDRAKIGKTHIGFGTKIDNLCQIAHNVFIGSHTVICALTGIAGSVYIGNGCVIGAQVGIADHAVVEDGAVIAAKSGITKLVKSKETVMGNPSHQVDLARKLEAFRRRTPELYEEFKDVKKKITEMEEKILSINKKI